MNCALETLHQANEAGVAFDRIVHATGSSGTQAGLVAGLAAMSADLPVLGIGTRAPKEKQEAMVLSLAERTAERIGAPGAVTADCVEANTDYVGEGYGIPTTGGIETFVRLEGILLDPVYSAKGAVGLMTSPAAAPSRASGSCSCTPAARSDSSATTSPSIPAPGRAENGRRAGPLPRLAKSFTPQAALPAASLEAAAGVLEGAALHRCGAEPSEVAALEAELAAWQGARFTLAVASSGQALQIALRTSGVRPGDRVLTGAFTLAPVPGAIAAVGAEPVLVEIGEDLRLDADDLAAKAGAARHLLLSHMRGRLSDMDQIGRICAEAGLTLIEDCAHSMGASWGGVRSGSHGLAGCFSTQTCKHLNSGEGGRSPRTTRRSWRAPSCCRAATCSTPATAPPRPRRPSPRSGSTPPTCRRGWTSCAPRSCARSSRRSTRPWRPGARPTIG